MGPVGPIHAPVSRAMDGSGQMPKQFHDVDFAASGPSDVRIVGSEHQIAGQMPCPFGKMARTSMRPYWNSCKSNDFNRAEV